MHLMRGAASLLTGMRDSDEMLRASGQCGPKVAVPEDADAQTKLTAFVGSDPDWAAGRS